MTPVTGPDLACFGYLAYAQVTAVTASPAANSGAQVAQVFPSLAGDAPITALTARRLGSTAHLISNRVSLDPGVSRDHPRATRRIRTHRIGHLQRQRTTGTSAPHPRSRSRILRRPCPRLPHQSDRLASHSHRHARFERSQRPHPAIQHAGMGRTSFTASATTSLISEKIG